MPSSEPIQPLPQHFGVCPYLDASVYHLWVWIAAAVCEYLKYLTAQSKLTNFMELSCSSEATNYAATQELPSNLWNLKVHYHVHKSPLLVPILFQIDPIHTTPSCLSKIHFNIIHQPISWCS
jgi:hypothetical protein